MKADLGTLTLGTPVNVGQATKVQRSLSVSTDPVSGNMIVVIRACLCDANGKPVGNVATYSKLLAAMPQATQDVILAALSSAYDVANTVNPTGFPK